MNPKKKPSKKRPGRPRIENPEPVSTLSIRLNEELNEVIAAAAKKNRRAKSSEILATLEKHYLDNP